MHTVHSYDMGFTATRASGSSDRNLRIAVAVAFVGLVATAFALVWVPAVAAALAQVS